MKSSTILKRTKRLIADPEKHLGGDGLPDDDSRTGPASRREQGQFCLFIAFRECGGPSWGKGWDYLDNASNEIFKMDAIGANDRHGYDAAHIILDGAIKQALKEGD